MYKQDKFTKVYLNIITEGYSYYRRKHPKMFTINQIIGATKQLTEDCKGQWLKGQTGKKVAELCLNGQVQASTTPEEIEYIKKYWSQKANKSGNTFDEDISYTLNGSNEINQFSCGKAAYGIFIALNSKYKDQNNLNEPVKGTFVGEPGQKMTLMLKYVKLVWEKDYVGDGWVHKPQGNGFYYWDHPQYTARIYQLEDEAGNVFICRTSSDNVASYIEDLTDFTSVKCSIINHNVFRDTNQTEIKISAPRASRKKIEVVNTPQKPQGDQIPADAEVTTVDQLDDLNKY